MRRAEGELSSTEPALERLLLRIVPGLAAEWQGASDAEVARLESLAGRPLPAFYRWFLERLGKSMGPMIYPGVDFSAQGVIDIYAAGRIAPDPRFLLIGYDHDDVSPLHYFYDLDAALRGDALVVRMLTPKDESHEQFETLREMLAWGELYAQRVAAAPQQCRGVLRFTGASLGVTLEPALAELGFEAPLETGRFCGLFERQDAALVASGTPGDPPGRQSFALGGHDAASLAQVLSTLATRADVEIDIAAWAPPLPGNGS
jgi:hypothetical protein